MLACVRWMGLELTRPGLHVPSLPCAEKRTCYYGNRVVLLTAWQPVLQDGADSLYHERQQLRLEVQASVGQMLMLLHSAAALHARAQHRMMQRSTDTSGEPNPHVVAEQLPLLRQLTGEDSVCIQGCKVCNLLLALRHTGLMF